MKRIVIVEVGNIINQPPTISLILNLLSNGHKVKLISTGGELLADSILQDPNFTYIPLKHHENKANKILQLITRCKEIAEVRKETRIAMTEADILWTTSINTVRDLQDEILKYKNIFQLMELAKYGYTSRLTTFPLGELARKSWKNVVPEENRAYIEKAWWDLERVPYILPNKPYNLSYGTITEDMTVPLEKMKNEKRKILLYLGGIFPDRSLESYAEAIHRRDNEFVLYIVGKAFNEEAGKRLKELVEKYNAVYLGFFQAPKHLAFVEHAYIGLLPYKTTHCFGLSDLNALYCAPNKIFEYAGFGIPMIGSNVLGLKNIFEKWNIGICCNDSSEEELFCAISVIDSQYKIMKKNCISYYNSIDLDQIVDNIINE